MLEYNAYLPTTPNAAREPNRLSLRQSTTPRINQTSFVPLFEVDDLNEISGIANELDDTAGGINQSGFDSEFLKKMQGVEQPALMSKYRASSLIKS